jgi:hypothetical protein
MGGWLKVDLAGAGPDKTAALLARASGIGWRTQGMLQDVKLPPTPRTARSSRARALANCDIYKTAGYLAAHRHHHGCSSPTDGGHPLREAAAGFFRAPLASQFDFKAR